MPGTAGTIDPTWTSICSPGPLLLPGVNSCRKLLSVSIDITSNAPTAASRLYTFGPEARSSLPRRPVSTVVGSFSSCRTNRGNRTERPATATELCNGGLKPRGGAVRSSCLVRASAHSRVPRRTDRRSDRRYDSSRPAIRFKKESSKS